MSGPLLFLLQVTTLAPDFPVPIIVSFPWTGGIGLDIRINVILAVFFFFMSLSRETFHAKAENLQGTLLEQLRKCL